MSTPSELSPEPAPGLEESLAAALNHEISRHARLLHVMKGQMSALVPTGLDMAAFGLLFTLVKCGPKRQGELAELALLDPSTVSRHVAQLAKAGYVQRRADPIDGRAVQLVASDEGMAVARHIGERRQAVISGALAGWAPDDVRRFVTLMARFNDDLDAFRPHLVQTLVEPLTARPAGSRTDHDVPDQRSADQEIA